MRSLSCCFMLSVLILTSCGKEVLSPMEYVRWLEDEENGLRVSKVIGDIKYTLQYKTKDYITVLEEKKQELESKMVGLRSDELKDMQYYTLRLAAKDKATDVMSIGSSSQQDYINRTGYLSFDMQNDIVLVEDNDTLLCKLFHFVPNYGLAPYVDFVLAFDNLHSEQAKYDKEFILDDRAFGNGAVKLVIQKDDISNIPSLKTN